MLRILSLFACLLVCASCGGGGGGSQAPINPPPPPIQPPPPPDTSNNPPNAPRGTSGWQLRYSTWIQRRPVTIDIPNAPDITVGDGMLVFDELIGQDLYECLIDLGSTGGRKDVRILIKSGRLVAEMASGLRVLLTFEEDVARGRLEHVRTRAQTDIEFTVCPQFFDVNTPLPGTWSTAAGGEGNATLQPFSWSGARGIMRLELQGFDLPPAVTFMGTSMVPTEVLASESLARFQATRIGGADRLTIEWLEINAQTGKIRGRASYLDDVGSRRYLSFLTNWTLPRKP